MFNHYHNWRITLDKDGIIWLYFDCEDSNVNTLHTKAIQELEKAIDEIQALDKKPKGLVILSAKDKSFCMGADINEFREISDLEVLKKHIDAGQQVLQKIENLSFPTVALIHGFCLGGGMELALSCRYRIAQSDDKTLMGLPEVRLGLLPAWGGSVRLVRLISPLKALMMMLTGKMQDAKTAKRIGLVDISVPKRVIENAARDTILHPLKRRQFSIISFLFQFKFLRHLTVNLLKKQVEKHANPLHYPAPYTILKNWCKYGTSHEAYAQEVDSFIELLKTDTAKNLIRVFFLQENLKSHGKKIDSRVKHVHVIGAGTMGAAIASWCAFKGLKVSIQDKDTKSLQKAMQHAPDNLIPDVAGDGIAHADLIIEAVFEDLSVKQNLLKEIDKRAKSDAIIASNTSSISLDALKVALKAPERLVGIHFFNPVSKMQLVEVVHTEDVLPEILNRATAFVHQIGKLPLPVKNCPGFLVNRVIVPYLMETFHLMQAGASVTAIDKAATDFGMVMGPVAMVDLVGLDVCWAVAKNLSSEAPQILQDKIAQGHLGKKTGEGFYRYRGDKRLGPAMHTENKLTSEEIIDRLLQPLIKECVACYHEKIAMSLDDIDAGVIFGMGFAPYLGGPMQYAKQKDYPI